MGSGPEDISSLLDHIAADYRELHPHHNPVTHALVETVHTAVLRDIERLLPVPTRVWLLVVRGRECMRCRVDIPGGTPLPRPGDRVRLDGAGTMVLRVQPDGVEHQLGNRTVTLECSIEALPEGIPQGWEVYDGG